MTGEKKEDKILDCVCWIWRGSILGSQSINSRKEKKEKTGNFSGWCINRGACFTIGQLKSFDFCHYPIQEKKKKGKEREKFGFHFGYFFSS